MEKVSDADFHTIFSGVNFQGLPRTCVTVGDMEDYLGLKRLEETQKCTKKYLGDFEKTDIGL